MSDDIVITPRIQQRSDRPAQRRAREERRTQRTKQKKRKLLKRMRQSKTLRKLQGGGARRGAHAAGKAGGLLTGASKLGIKGASRLAGPVGVALLLYDAISYAGGAVRRAEGGISGRLLDAQDQNDIYGLMDEQATAASNTRGLIEGDPDLLEIIGAEGRINSQIAKLGAWFKERETARAIGADVIDREPGFDHLESVLDKAIDNAMVALKSDVDGAIDAVKEFFGGSTKASGR